MSRCVLTPKRDNDFLPIPGQALKGRPLPRESLEASGQGGLIGGGLPNDAWISDI